ncbi:hypothetical protein EJ06DRAFT_554658 [Trichodelitschia bisporula]|uniref:Mitochondrial ribosomal protein-like protein n=1 Tax=Trichodelitschia bisporula TaxID=703511 RepID=A0A6G1I4A5_9PEZI|nr:hypothetical protein EJ06DRAFT_554658 [Trichodelitschia bisporula]
MAAQRRWHTIIPRDQLSNPPEGIPVTWLKPRKKLSKIYVHPPPRSMPKKCPDPVGVVTASQLATLDSSGARARLFDKENTEGVRVGDVLHVRMREGEPVSGVCLNIRRRGVETAILLRNQLTRVGVEVWVKVFSPLVQSVEIVQRRVRRARRARLYYMRQPKHDMGSVEGLVRTYLRQRAVLGSGGKGAAEMLGKKGKGKGKKK